jgi:hypothetical protein
MKTHLSDEKIIALAEAFPFHAKGDYTIHDEVQDVIAWEDAFGDAEEYYLEIVTSDQEFGLDDDDTDDDPMIGDIYLIDLADDFSFFSCNADNTPKDDADEMVKLQEEDDFDNLVHAFPHLCVSL